MKKTPYLYKRGDVWWCDFVYRGVRYRKGLGTNKAFATEKLLAWKSALKNRRFSPTNWDSFKQRYIEWGEANKNKLTVNKDCLAFKYFDEYIKIKDVNDINVLVLDGYKTWLIKHGKQPKNINRMLSCIRACVSKAEQWGLIEHKNFKAVKDIKTTKGRVLFYSPEEIKKILDVSPDNWKLVVLLGCRAGLRRGEIVNLDWSDIDLDKRIITVQPKDNWQPKDYECRDIPIDDLLFGFLNNIKDKTGRVVKTIYNKDFSLDGISQYFIQKILKKVGLRGSLHTLRHTFASHLVQNGVDLYTVSKLLGHSSINTTEIYAHLSPNSFKSALCKLPKI